MRVDLPKEPVHKFTIDFWSVSNWQTSGISHERLVFYYDRTPYAEADMIEDKSGRGTDLVDQWMHYNISTDTYGPTGYPTGRINGWLGIKATDWMNGCYATRAEAVAKAIKLAEALAARLSEEIGNLQHRIDKWRNEQ